MSSTIQRYAPPANGRAPVSQATSIEQSRAIADVQAAVTVAQNCPRDMAEAEAEMVYVCGRLSVAEQAFYRVQNRGTGPSVHLMRELARIWGNIDYGVKELARDDTKGESEVLATCWDMQKNTRSSRTFIVPHARMAAGSRRQLDDLQDIYLNNQNIGARAVRECIETVLPKWFTERAQEVCRQTLANGEGEPLSERIQASIAWFRDRLGVTLAQLETSVGRERGKWTADDLAQLKISGKSITAGEVGRDEVFPPIVADTVEACDTDPAAEPEKPPAESKLAGKVKAAKPDRATADERAKPETEPVSEGAMEETANPEDSPPPPPEPPADVEPEPNSQTDAAPGAPTANTPGQTDRVAAALNKANKGGAQRAMADMIETALAKVAVTDPADIRAVASHILGREIGENTLLDLKLLKQVQDTVFAWRDLGTLDQMVTNAINAEDYRKANEAADQPADDNN